MFSREKRFVAILAISIRWISIKFDSDNKQPTLKTGFQNQIPQFQKFWTQVILSLRLI